MGGLPGESRPVEARLGGETVKHSHQMCWHVMITPGSSGLRALTGTLSLWLTSAGLFIISYSPFLTAPLPSSCSFGACTLAQAGVFQNCST